MCNIGTLIIWIGNGEGYVTPFIQELEICILFKEEQISILRLISQVEHLSTAAKKE